MHERDGQPEENLNEKVVGSFEEHAREWALSATSWVDAKCRWQRCAEVAKGDLSGSLLMSMGRDALKWGYEYEARQAFREARECLVQDVTAKREAEEMARQIDCRLVESWHWRMINDVDRNLAFCDALEECCKGKSVLDVGTGTGLLALAAKKSGANRVVACERSAAMADVARRTFENHDAIIELRTGDSSEVLDDYEAFDVAVAEVFDAALFGEGALETLRQIRRVAQIVVPARATLCCAVVHSPVLRRRCVFDGRVTVEPYDIASLDSTPHHFLSDVARFENILHVGNEHRHLGTRKLTRIAAGVADAIVAWFELDMLGDRRFVLSTAPRRARGTDVSYLATSWQQAVFGITENDDFRSVSASLVPGDGESEFLKLALDDDDERVVFMTPTQVERANDATWREAYAAEGEDGSRVLEVGFGSSIAGPLRRQPVARYSTSLDGLKEEHHDFDKIIHSLVDPSGQLRQDALADVDRCIAQIIATRRPRFAPAAATAFGVFVDSPDLAAEHYVKETGIPFFDASALDEFASPHARDIELYRDFDGSPIVNILTKPVRLIALEDFGECRSSALSENKKCSSFETPGPVEAGAALPVSHQVVAEKAGSAHALIYWWHLHFRRPREQTISTSPFLDIQRMEEADIKGTVKDTSMTHWRVAAFILRRGTGLPLHVGDRIQFSTALRYSQIHVDGLSIDDT